MLRCAGLDVIVRMLETLGEHESVRNDLRRMDEPTQSGREGMGLRSARAQRGGLDLVQIAEICGLGLRYFDLFRLGEYAECPEQ